MVVTSVVMVGAELGPMDEPAKLAVGGTNAAAVAAAAKDDHHSAAKVAKKTASSLLSWARNHSAINLPSLATVAHRLGSASAGNLWSPGAHQQRRELAELAGESPVVKPLDYVAGAHFDHHHQHQHQHQLNQDDASSDYDPNNNSITFVAPKPKLYLETPTSTSQQAGSKDKRKRLQQKEAERVEKLRLLVSYLRQGPNLQLLDPVTLEADELELAERYKLHLALCDHCLDQQQATNDAASRPSAAGCQLHSGSRTPEAPVIFAERRPSNQQDQSKQEQEHHHQQYHDHQRTQLGASTSSTPALGGRLSPSQNLATWIDNEVNSLVNDLETKSQLMMKSSAKSNSGSKLKWLAGGIIRRNSSGAHST